MDTSNMCRTCLRVPRNAISLYDELSLMGKIQEISSVEIIVSKDYPSMICKECVDNINNFFNFKKVIANSDKDIKERLSAIQRKSFNSPTSKQNNKVDKQNSTQDENNVENMHFVDIDNYGFEDGTSNDSTNLDTQDQKIQNTKAENHDPDIQTENILSELKAIATYKLYKCKLCKETFPSSIKLANHRKTVHFPRVVCNICGLCLRADNLSKHIRLHSEAPMNCEVCGKIFKNSESLRSHNLMHKNMIFTCEICGRTFKVKSEHTRHLRCHADPDLRKSTCTVCGKKVNRMARHMLSHTGERPHLCTFCGKGFTSGNALKVHVRQHTNEKPYSCEYCPASFPQKVSLRSHLRTKHGVV